jgi:hypothetical protein
MRDVLMNGIQTGKTIWHKSVRGSGGGLVDLALFNGQIVYPNGETGTYAGVEIINLADGKDSGQVIVLLEDGSISNQVVRGEVTFNEGATLSVASGSGKWWAARGGLLTCAAVVPTNGKWMETSGAQSLAPKTSCTGHPLAWPGLARTPHLLPRIASHAAVMGGGGRTASLPRRRRFWAMADSVNSNYQGRRTTLKTHLRRH